MLYVRLLQRQFALVIVDFFEVFGEGSIEEADRYFESIAALILIEDS